MMIGSAACSRIERRKRSASDRLLVSLLLGEIARDHGDHEDVLVRAAAGRARAGSAARRRRSAAARTRAAGWRRAPHAGAAANRGRSRSGRKRSSGPPITCSSGARDHGGKAAVGEQDGAVLAQRDGALLHALDQDAVRLVGALQGVDARAVGTLDDHGVDRARADRLPASPPPRRGARAAPRWFRSGTSALSSMSLLRCGGTCKSSPAITRCGFERSPTSLRNGSGSRLTRVGAATSCSRAASSGCWYRSTTSRS